MTQIGEGVAVWFIQDEMHECPFKENSIDSGVSEVVEEDIKNDDMKSAQKEQVNSGGALGKNLTDGSSGASGTVGGPYAPDDYLVKETPKDSKPDRGEVYVFVEGADEYVDGVYPFVVAAHHLIPGNAALKKSDLRRYMKKGESVQSGGKSWKISCHIGYNVNGAHNGIWLPGTYAVRKGEKAWYKSPDSKKTWSELGQHDWCLNYVAAVSKVTGCQFHDAHKKYSMAVEEMLNKIAVKLIEHQANCKECAEKANGEVAPPYFIKGRLYNISNYLRNKLDGNPQDWKRPWFTSDKWRDIVFHEDGSINIAYLDAHDAARSINMKEGVCS